MPGSWEEIIWLDARGCLVSAEDDPRAVREFWRILQTPMPEHEPGPEGVDLAPSLDAYPFALGLKDGRVVLGDASRLEGAEFTSWLNAVRLRLGARGEDGPVAPSPSLRLQVPAWQVVSVYRHDLPSRQRCWQPADTEFRGTWGALAGEILAHSPAVVLCSPAKEEREEFYGGEAGSACMIGFDTPAQMTVCRADWDPWYYWPREAPRLQSLVTRPEAVKCDKVVLLPYTDTEPAALVFYHLAGEEGWWYAGSWYLEPPEEGS
jgi:hypothetical protein